MAELSRTHDLVVAADGVNSTVRARYADTFQPTLDIRHGKYMWLGTDKVFDSFKFYVRQTPYGVMQIHGYPYDAKASTFIVEMNESVWQRAGFAALAAAELAPGESDEKSVGLVRELFADILDGHCVLLNNSRWVSFATVRNERWRHGNMVLLGDAAHTAHFSIGSGTKLAMEDALALAACLHEQPDLPRPRWKPMRMNAGPWCCPRSVRRRPAWSGSRTSASTPGRTRSSSRSTSSPAAAGSATTTCGSATRSSSPRWTAGSPGTSPTAGMGTGEVRPPMFQPFRLRDLELANRVVVSPMDMYVASGRPAR